MDTRGKSNTEFRNEVSEILTRHESSFDHLNNNNFNQVNLGLQSVLAELQALRITHTHKPVSEPVDVNPFATGAASHITHPNPILNSTVATNPQPKVNPTSNLKLSFPKFTGDDPTGWIYRAEQYFEGPLTWDDFTTALLRRFGPTDFEDPSEALTRLKQNTTVAVYQEEFERLSQLVDALPDIRTPPTTSATGLLGPSPNHNLKPSNTTSSAPFKRITGQEARARREKGLCYYCDEKYIPGHCCNNPQLFMIEDFPTTDEPSLEPNPTELVPEISYHAMTGTSHPQTIRVLGKLQNHEVTVLIDGGSTHNFIDQNVVSKFGLHVVQDKTFQVMVANREKIDCAGQCFSSHLGCAGSPHHRRFLCPTSGGLSSCVGGSMVRDARTHRNKLPRVDDEILHAWYDTPISRVTAFRA
ncbi:hypothetical protein Acr_00g0057160 [Actinidia rufa]|uniref:Retrotransposon gag domain-containing protein n=1 Tax=Actinidia rufa TaxID=165716 RepID=A0A7J0DMQ1_9ERIC|nr:hypothetical protein Acr_00g0057160 [Actinidia rufa]